MRKLITLIITTLLIVIGFALPASARSNLSCGSPTHLNITDGNYTTSSQVQYNSTDFVLMDAFSKDYSTQQDMYVCSISEWDLTINENDTVDPVQVHEYPSSSYRLTQFTDCAGHSPREDEFTHLVGTYGLSSPGGALAVYDNAWDIWTGGTYTGTDCGTPGHEVMIWTKWHGQGQYLTTQVNHTVPDGTNYNIGWNANASLIQVYQTTQTTSGTTHIKQVLDYLTTLTYDGTHSVLGNNSRVHEVKYGTEILTTGGVDKTFHNTAFSVDPICSVAYSACPTS